VFYINDHPSAGWAHPVRYIFMDQGTGLYQVVNQNQYPYSFRQDYTTEFELVSERQTYPAVGLPPNITDPLDDIDPNPNLYAVLIGTEDRGDPTNPNDFWYSISLMYNTLIQAYGFTDENIFVHFADGDSDMGSDLNNPDNNEDHIDYDSDRERIMETFANLAGDSYSDPDVPVLGPSDVLFVYNTGHGIEDNGHSVIRCRDLNTGAYESLVDSDLADQVENINCAQMIFLFQQCYSGNFRWELTDYSGSVACENRIVHTATSIDLMSTSEYYLTGNHYGEFTYYWCAAIRGFYPVTASPWEQSIYETGSFPFDVLYPPPYNSQHPGDIDPDNNPERGNNDDIIQMEEAFYYADYLDVWSPTGWYKPDLPDGKEIPKEEYTMGCVNMTTLAGLAGYAHDQYLTSGRNYVVSGEIFTDNDFLEIDDDVTIYMQNTGTRIQVDVGGDLYINDNISFYNMEINVDGEMDVGSGVTFNNMSLNLNNNSKSTVFDDVTFETVDFTSYNESTSIENSFILDCYVFSFFNGDVSIKTSNIDNTWICCQDQPVNSNKVTLLDCNLSNNVWSAIAGIDIWNFDYFLISGNEFEGFYNAMQIYNSGSGSRGDQDILENTVYDNSHSGIVLYNTTAQVVDNKIYNNSDKGVRLLNNSNNVELVGSQISDGQLIYDNDNYEIYASQNSFPVEFEYNQVYDEDNIGNPVDPLVYHDFTGGLVLRDVRNNYWGQNFNASEDFYPTTGYVYLPVWTPPTSKGTKDVELAKTMYDESMIDFEQKNYSNAQSTLKQLVNDYPKTKYAAPALKHIFSLEKFVNNSYEALIQYYTTTDSIILSPNLIKVGDFLANRCELLLENWQSAIDHYENIIQNPESFEDSIFAIIDLGYTYMLMENSGEKGTYFGKLLQYVPQTKSQFIVHRDYLLSLLPGALKGQFHHEIDKGLKEGEVMQNVPNPFTGKTTIYYKLDSDAKVELNVFNTTGQLVGRVNEGTMEKGTHSVQVNASDLPSGIYHYSITINGKTSNTKKMTIVN